MEFLFPAQTTEDERSRNAQVAILPIGSFEQHGPYLPLATDTVIASLIALALSGSYPVLHVAPIAISCSHEHSAWPGTVSISARTLYAVISDIRDSLHQSGIRKLVLVNGHGGNYVLQNVVQEATISGPYMALFPSADDWVKAREAAGLVTTDQQDMHAGELETSILLDGCPGIIRDGYQSADHLADNRSHLLTRGMQEYTESGIIGRPSLASTAKGKAAMASLIQSFGECMRSMMAI
jgi:creatinine amidohydrolase